MTTRPCVAPAGRPSREPADTRPLHVLVAPDSFKGSLTSVEVARALATGWQRARPDDGIRLAPLADGGEGTLVAIDAAGGWQWHETDARDPLGRPIRASWLARDDGRAAVIEMATASGLSRVAAAERDAVNATTAGTGDLLRAVLDAGIREVALGIGGSATTDGGAGMLRALGATVSEDLAAVDLSGLDPRLAETSLRIACDVSNPLLGPDGAAAVYGPRRARHPGWSPPSTNGWHASRTPWRRRPAAASATPREPEPRAGSGSGSCASRGISPRSAWSRASTWSWREAGFDLALGTADLVITGEGRIDAQTAFGKTALGVAKRAHAAGVPCIAVGGGVTAEGIAALGGIGVTVVPVSEGPQTVEQAMAAGAAPVERCGERIARLVVAGADGVDLSPPISPS